MGKLQNSKGWASLLDVFTFQESGGTATGPWGQKSLALWSWLCCNTELFDKEIANMHQNCYSLSYEIAARSQHLLTL